MIRVGFRMQVADTVTPTYSGHMQISTCCTIWSMLQHYTDVSGATRRHLQNRKYITYCKFQRRKRSRDRSAARVDVHRRFGEFVHVSWELRYAKSRLKLSQCRTAIREVSVLWAAVRWLSSTVFNLRVLACRREMSRWTLIQSLHTNTYLHARQHVQRYSTASCSLPLCLSAKFGKIGRSTSWRSSCSCSHRRCFSEYDGSRQPFHLLTIEH